MTFDQKERILFAKLADILIPAGDAMPSASEADVGVQWLDAVLAARPDLASPLKELLKHASGHSLPSNVAELQNRDAAGFAVLTEIVPAAYFMNPTVQQAIGYGGQTPRPIDPHPDYLDDGLLDTVISRGPVYRPTPTSS